MELLRITIVNAKSHPPFMYIRVILVCELIKVTDKCTLNEITNVQVLNFRVNYIKVHCIYTEIMIWTIYNYYIISDHKFLFIFIKYIRQLVNLIINYLMTWHIFFILSCQHGLQFNIIKRIRNISNKLTK